MAHHETLLIKHAVTGRMLADSRQDQGWQYLFRKNGTAFEITVSGLGTAVAGDIVRWKAELNVFRFVQTEGSPIIKHWYYIDPEQVMHDPAQDVLSLTAVSEIEYNPADYWAD
ncbi:hypothetical protein [Paenibacillus lacisoli]|nr:hypothetical protein [Paenibacillus sp. JX-17]